MLGLLGYACPCSSCVTCFQAGWTLSSINEAVGNTPPEPEYAQVGPGSLKLCVEYIELTCKAGFFITLGVSSSKMEHSLDGR